jgi:hypothetical protein
MKMQNLQKILIYEKNVIPKYGCVGKVHDNTITVKYTKIEAQYLRAKNEIWFLYLREQHLNKRLYEIYLLNARE